MPTSTFSAVVAGCLCTAVAAQGPTLPLQPLPQPDVHSGGGGDAAPAVDRHGFRMLDAAAQDPDQYSLHTLFQQEHGDFMLRRERFAPMIDVRASSLTSAAVQHEPGHFDLLQFEFDADVPLTITPEAYLEVGAFYQGRHYQARNMGTFGDETLFAGGIKAGFGWFLNADTLLEGHIDAGSWSDWDGTLTRRDYDFPASALLTLRYSNELFWKVGARYSEVYEDANVLPSLGFSFVGEMVRVDVLAPEMFEVSLWPTQDFGVLFGAEIRGAEYHVRSSSGTTPPHQRADVRVQEVLIYTGALWRTSDHLSFEARVGAAVAGDYKLDDGDAATKRVTGTLEPSLFLEFSMGLDF